MLDPCFRTLLIFFVLLLIAFEAHIYYCVRARVRYIISCGFYVSLYVCVCPIPSSLVFIRVFICRADINDYQQALNLERCVCLKAHPLLCSAGFRYNPN